MPAKEEERSTRRLHLKPAAFCRIINTGKYKRMETRTYSSIKYLLACLMAVYCLACSTTTEVTGSWKNPDVTLKPMNTVLVTALTGRNNARQTVETDLAKALQKDGIKSVRSLDILPPSFTASKEPDKEA